MTVHTIGDSGLTLFLDPQDFVTLGLEQSQLDELRARTLIKDTMEHMGLSNGLLEISAFVGKGGAMVVALLENNAPQSWLFYQVSNTDALLDIWQLTAAAPCRIFRLNNVYYIAVCEETAAQETLAKLPEFGVKLYRPQSFLVYLEEHAASADLAAKR